MIDIAKDFYDSKFPHRCPLDMCIKSISEF
jgi:hypothetical protein